MNEKKLKMEEIVFDDCLYDIGDTSNFFLKFSIFLFCIRYLSHFSNINHFIMIKL